MKLVSISVFALFMAASAFAQDVPAPTPTQPVQNTPAPPTLQEQIDLLKKENQLMRDERSQPPRTVLTVDQRLKEAQLRFEKIFKETRLQAEAGCKAAKGKLSISADSSGKITATCAF